MQVCPRFKLKKCCSLELNSWLSIELKKLFQPYGSTAARQHLNKQVSVELYEKQNSSSVLTLIRDYVFGLSFLTTLDILKDNFKGRQSVHKLHKCWAKFVQAICNRRQSFAPSSSLLKKLLCLCAVGFYDQASSRSSSCGWIEKICSQQPSLVDDWSCILGSAAQLVSYVLGSCASKGEIVTTKQVQLGIRVRVQL